MSDLTLLDDRQVQAFLRDGYITLDAGPPADFHARLHDRITQVFDSEGNPGNDILPRVPDLHQVLEWPTVAGALTSLLGPRYLLHPHRHCHLNPAGSDGQRMHQDSYEADQNVRHHRVRWLMAFYYPQDVDAGRGPSSIVPATQYLTADDQHGSPTELPFVGRAGSVTIVHYDLWHRAMANVGQRDRFMVKFLFTRMSEPRTASWRHEGGGWNPTGGADDALCAHLWDWLRGVGTAIRPPSESPAAELARRLTAREEIDRCDAAYRLGAMGEAAVPTLIDALRREGASRVEANLERSHTNPVQFEAAYGLTAAGAASVPALNGLLSDEAWWLRASAADILGDIGLEASGSVGALTDALTDESDWVRRNTVEALGNIGHEAAAANGSLARCLSDTSVEVRHNAALALGKTGGGNQGALEKAGADENLYVRELSATALARS